MSPTYAPKQTTTRGHTVPIDDIEMYYEEYGAGKPLVLLHGFGGCAKNWHPFAAELSARHRLLIVDLRGHGHSTNPEGTFTHRKAACDVFLMRRASIGTMPQPVQEMYRECAQRGDEQIRQLIAQFNAMHDDHDDMSFTAQSLSTIAARTLVVHGDRDRFFPVEVPVGIYRSIPNAALWIVPGGDHVPIYDSTVPFTSTALRFLDVPDSK